MDGVLCAVGDVCVANTLFVLFSFSLCVHVHVYTCVVVDLHIKLGVGLRVRGLMCGGCVCVHPDSSLVHGVRVCGVPDHTPLVRLYHRLHHSLSAFSIVVLHDVHVSTAHHTCISWWYVWVQRGGSGR